MPELPEVQLMTEQLAARLCGQRISQVQVWDAKIRLPVGRLVGRRIETIRRRAKFIILDLEGDVHLLVHLRMTGWFEFEQPKRFRWALATPAATAWFVDSRRFGQVQLLTAQQLDQQMAGLGPEPFAGPDVLDRLDGQRPIKVALLDQRVIAGVGNIYASESLWAARIDPRRPAGSLSAPERRRLQRSIIKVLRRALDWGEAVFENYADLAVYERDGKACRRHCGGRIQRLVQQQRSTYFCPVCQGS